MNQHIRPLPYGNRSHGNKFDDKSYVGNMLCQGLKAYQISLCVSALIVATISMVATWDSSYRAKEKNCAEEEWVVRNARKECR